MEVDYGSEFGINEKGNYFRITKEVFDNLEKKVGFVYVLDKKFFKEFSGMEWRSNEKMKPLFKIKVTSKDLPKNIDILD